MEMRSIPNASFLSETLRKEDDARKARVPADGERSCGTDEFAASVKAVRPAEPAAAAEAANRLAAPAQAVSPVRAAHPAYDRYVPESTQGQESFGHYQQVTDKDGKPRIQFDHPTDTAQESREGDAGNDVPQAASEIEQKGMKPSENTAHNQDKRNADSAEEKSKPDLDQLTGGKKKLQELKKQKKQLEQKIKMTKDTLKAGSLKRKLAQVERAIKAAAH